MSEFEWGLQRAEFGPEDVKGRTAGREGMSVYFLPTR